MNKTQYPSFADVERELAPRIKPIRQATVYAEYAEPATRPIHYRSVVREKTAPTKTQSAEIRSLLKDHACFLQNIRDYPADGLKSHFKRLRWGVSKGYARLGQLQSSGYVEFLEVPSKSPKGGRSRQVLQLTERGREFLQAYENQTP